MVGLSRKRVFHKTKGDSITGQDRAQKHCDFRFSQIEKKSKVAVLQLFRPQTISSPSRFAPIVDLPLVYIRSSVVSNLGLNCLHTAKIATYFKGVQVHNVLLLEYITLETCMHRNLVGRQAYISSFTSLLKVYKGM